MSVATFNVQGHTLQIHHVAQATDTQPPRWSLCCLTCCEVIDEDTQAPGTRAAQHTDNPTRFWSDRDRVRSYVRGRLALPLETTCPTTD
jgi:hypothetical protein